MATRSTRLLELQGMLDDSSVDALQGVCHRCGELQEKVLSDKKKFYAESEHLKRTISKMLSQLDRLMRPDKLLAFKRSLNLEVRFFTAHDDQHGDAEASGFEGFDTRPTSPASDFAGATIDRLEKDLGRLEKENRELKKEVAKLKYCAQLGRPRGRANAECQADVPFPAGATSTTSPARTGSMPTGDRIRLGTPVSRGDGCSVEQPGNDAVKKPVSALGQPTSAANIDLDETHWLPEERGRDSSNKKLAALEEQLQEALEAKRLLEKQVADCEAARAKSQLGKMVEVHQGMGGKNADHGIVAPDTGGVIGGRCEPSVVGGSAKRGGDHDPSAKVDGGRDASPRTGHGPGRSGITRRFGIVAAAAAAYSTVDNSCAPSAGDLASDSCAAASVSAGGLTPGGAGQSSDASAATPSAVPSDSSRRSTPGSNGKLGLAGALPDEGAGVESCTQSSTEAIKAQDAGGTAAPRRCASLATVQRFTGRARATRLEQENSSLHRRPEMVDKCVGNGPGPGLSDEALMCRGRSPDISKRAEPGVIRSGRCFEYKLRQTPDLLAELDQANILPVHAGRDESFKNVASKASAGVFNPGAEPFLQKLWEQRLDGHRTPSHPRDELVRLGATIPLKAADKASGFSM